MEVIELRTVNAQRNIEWPTTLDEFLDEARTLGHGVAKLHGIDRWMIFNPISMAWCEVGYPVSLPSEDSP